MRLPALLPLLLLVACSSAPTAAMPEPVPPPVATTPAPVAPAPVTPPVTAPASTVRILVIGDSISWTMPAGGVGAQQLWPQRLQDTMEAQGVDVRVSNYSWSGGTTRDARQRLRDGLYKTQYDVLFVQFGLNDTYDMAVPPEEFRAGIEDFIAWRNQVQPKAPLILLNVPNTDEKIRSDFVRYYREQVEKAAEAHAAEGVSVINLADAYRADEDTFIERDAGHRVHPNPEGHRRITDLIWSKRSIWLP